MIKIAEDHVSFETAKLLKEKGFDETVRCFYDIQTEILCDNCVKTKNSYTESIAAPTLQMAMKWLREVHHYYIQVMLDSWACGGHMGYYVVIQKTDSDFEMMLQDKVDNVFYETPEEAAEDAIKYILEDLI